jgi:Tol biopolymer transport system component
MNADGSQKRRLTFGPSADDSPEWAPNGRTLVFVSDRLQGRYAVYAINVQTGAARHVADGNSPAWTPDGRIIFAGEPDSKNEGKIFTVRPYGADLRPLARQPGNVSRAHVSGDGARLVYDRLDLTRDTMDVYTADSSGAHAKPLIAKANRDEYDARWSPDGQWVVYDAGPSNVTDAEPDNVHIVRADGTGDVRLTRSARAVLTGTPH